MAQVRRPVPFRTRKLRPDTVRVLHSIGCGRLARCRIILSSGELDCSPLFYYLKQVVVRAVYSRYSSRLLVAVRYDLPFRLERSANDISLLIVVRGLSISLLASPVATLLFYCSYRNTSNLLNIWNNCVLLNHRDSRFFFFIR